jgi:hypothetical protein
VGLAKRSEPATLIAGLVADAHGETAYAIGVEGE